ncbi:hypothetical protein HanPI659440_Chr08g0284801 [Helianthus annuus]|nr:hypothetical protein HanPI659440_Chr08g0284801 [Helianthus annuus]
MDGMLNKVGSLRLMDFIKETHFTDQKTAGYADHIFTSCYVVVVLWSKVSHWSKILPVLAFTFRDLLGVHKQMRMSSLKQSADTSNSANGMLGNMPG